MIIGVTGARNSGNSEVAKYISKKYDFKYVDVNAILQQIMYKNKNTEKGFLSDSDILRTQNEIDIKLSEIIETGIEKIVLDYSYLNNSYFRQKCNVVINVINNSIKNDNELSIYDRTDDNYHLKVDFSEEWKDKVSNYLDYNMLHDKKVSIIVPIYNTSEYLVKCVKSILGQSYQNLEIILINDGSTDNSLNICNMLASTDNRIRVINQENVGLAQTRNNGIDIATGDYICFIDSDDFIDKDMIETLLRNGEQHNCDISTVRAHIHLRNGKIVGYSDGPREIKEFKGLENVINGYSDGEISIAAWDKLYKKEALDGVRFDSDVFKEDADFILKLCIANRSFVTDTKEFYHYVKRNSNSITSKFNTKCFQLQEWAFKYYFILLNMGEEYKDTAEKCLFNSLTHIVKTYMRDLKRGIVTDKEYQNEIQNVTNNIIYLLLHTDNVRKFDDLDNNLEIINRLLNRGVILREKLPTLDVNCIGILWNTLNEDLMQEAIKRISEKAEIRECEIVDLEDHYRSFINEIYFFEREFDGIPYLKGCGLINQYDTNKIAIMNLLIKVSGITNNKMKGYVFTEIGSLKKQIREEFKERIKNYAYDTIFHLTVNEEEYEYTNGIVKKYVKRFGEQRYGR